MRAHDRRLADDVVEGLRAVAAVKAGHEAAAIRPILACGPGAPAEPAGTPSALRAPLSSPPDPGCPSGRRACGDRGPHLAGLQPRLPQLRHPLQADLGPRPGHGPHAGLRGHAGPHAPSAGGGGRRRSLRWLGEDGGYTAMLALAMLSLRARWCGASSCSGASRSAGRWARWPPSWSRPGTPSSRRPCARTWTFRSWRWWWRQPCWRSAARGAAGRCWSCSAWRACCGRRPGCSPRPTGCTVARALTRRAAAARALVAGGAAAVGAQRLAITGEPFHSLTFTRDTAETLGRPKGIENVPEVMPRRLGEILRWVPLVGGTAGFFLALRIARRGAGARCAGGAGRRRVRGDRHRRPVAARPLPVPAGGDARDLLRLRRAGLDRAASGTAWRRWWVAGAAVLLIAFVGSTVSHQTDRLDALRDAIQLRGADPGRPARPHARSAAPSRCWSAAHRSTCRTTGPVPILRLVSGPAAGRTSSRRSWSGRRGLYVATANRRRAREVRARPERPEALRARGAERLQAVAANESWVVYERGCRIVNGPCTHLRKRLPGVSVALWLRPGYSAAHGEDRLRLLPSGSDLVHGTPSRGTWPSTPRAAYWP